MAYYRSFRHRLVSAVSSWLGNAVYTSRRGLTRGLKRRGGLGFIPGGRDSAEDAFLRRLNFSGKVVYDVGGFHGLITLFFARNAARVITYEANPANVVRIWNNADINGFSNILIRNIAVGSRPDGLLTLRFDPLFAGAGTGDPNLQASMEARDAKQFTVAVTTLDVEQERYRLPPPDFIKVDIEGMEYDCLQGLEKTINDFHPELLIEIHGSDAADKLKNGSLVFDFLHSRGYEITDVEAGKVIHAATGKEHHLFCRMGGK